MKLMEVNLLSRLFSQRPCSCDYACSCHRPSTSNDVRSQRVRRPSKQSAADSSAILPSHPAFPPIGVPTTCQQLTISASTSTTHHRFNNYNQQQQQLNDQDSPRYWDDTDDDEIVVSESGRIRLRSRSPPTQLDLTGD